MTIVCWLPKIFLSRRNLAMQRLAFCCRCSIHLGTDCPDVDLATGGNRTECSRLSSSSWFTKEFNCVCVCVSMLVNLLLSWYSRFLHMCLFGMCPGLRCTLHQAVNSFVCLSNLVREQHRPALPQQMLRLTKSDEYSVKTITGHNGQNCPTKWCLHVFAPTCAMNSSLECGSKSASSFMHLPETGKT